MLGKSTTHSNHRRRHSSSSSREIKHRSRDDRREAEKRLQKREKGVEAMKDIEDN